MLFEQEPSTAPRAVDAGRHLTAGDEAWPDVWQALPDPPQVLYIDGDVSVLARPIVAVVGTRRASPRGLALARGLGRDLAALGWVVASGLARGIDAAAHRGALEAGGATIAVMATGGDLCYPRTHRPLLADIRGSGCSLTEYPPGTPPLKHHFPCRNRLLAALALGTVVVEAPLRSGAMITARLAADFGREVFAVPGPVDLETSRGCHHLLREGAHLVERVQDVVRGLGATDREEAPLKPDASGVLPVPVPGGAARWIWDRLDLEGVPRDVLRRRWPGTEAVWLEGLTALDLAGMIRRLPGGRLARSIWQG